MIVMKRTCLNLSGNLHRASRNCFAKNLRDSQLAFIYILPRQYHDMICHTNL
jgi:hypothetical protein